MAVDTRKEAVEAFIQSTLKDHVLSEGMPRTSVDTQDAYAVVELLRSFLEKVEALEARVRAADALADALTPFAFFDPDEPDITSDTTQKAWELRYQDRFKDWVDFGEIDAARNALAAYRATKEGGA